MLFTHKHKILPQTLALVFGVLFLLSCENDLKDVEKLINIKKEENVNISKDVTVIYSDSAIVKAQLTSPELREYPDSVGIYEFKKGVLIKFYDEKGLETQRIKADEAVQRMNEGITEFRKNVVVNMADGSIINTQELFYDEKKSIYYNSVPITMQFKDQRGNLQATSFISDLNFEKIDGKNMTGYYVPSSNSGLPSFGN